MQEQDSIWDAIDNDDVGLEPHEEHYGYGGLILDLRRALKRKGSTKLERADRARDVLLSCDRGYRARVAVWADAEFAQRVGELPLRLPIDEHRRRVRRLKVGWAEPLTKLLGVSTVNARERSHRPEDAHWRRYELADNRCTKARSKKRQTWLRGHRRSPAQLAAESRYYEKRKAARAKAKEAA